MKKILIIGAGLSKNFKDEYIFSVLKQLPHDIFVAVPQESEGWLSEFVKPNNILRLDFSNLTDCISKISCFCEINNIVFDAIFTFKEHFVCAASVIAQAFGCIYTPINNIFKASNNKLLFRKHYNSLVNDYIIKADFQILDDRALLSDIQIPMVMKPFFGSSSCGVQLVLPTTDIKHAVASSKKSIAHKFDAALDRTFLLEKYISGKAFSIDGIIQNHKVHFAGINEYIYGPLPHFVQIGNIIPANITKKEYKFCIKAMRQIVKHFGFNNMPFHAEVILNDGKLFLIEIACRMPGGKIPRGYQLAYGFNFVEQVANLYLGLPVSFERKTNCQIIQKGKHIFNDCDIVSLKIPKSAFAQCDFAVITNAGSHNNYPDQNNPVYFYTVISKSFKDAVRQSEQFEKQIRIKIRNT